MEDSFDFPSNIAITFSDMLFKHLKFENIFDL